MYGGSFRNILSMKTEAKPTGRFNVEDPTPGEVVGQPTTQDRPQHRRHNSPPSPQIAMALPCCLGGNTSSITAWE